MQKKHKKIIKLIVIEVIVLLISSLVIWFKAKTDNMFFPQIPVLILITVLGLLFLGFGIWFKKL